jgi:hypothetical protein
MSRTSLIQFLPAGQARASEHILVTTSRPKVRGTNKVPKLPSCGLQTADTRSSLSDTRTILAIILLSQTQHYFLIYNKMVIATSDSCNTLVSLENGLKQVQSTTTALEFGNVVQVDDEYRRTELILPADDFFDDDDDDNEFCYSNTIQQTAQHIYFPSQQPIDQYLKNVPQVMEACDELLANPPRHFTTASQERVLYVAQGEVAHAVPIQCDVIVSDKATTCHILAFRSETQDNVPLASLAHLDGESYESSIRSMLEEHIIHHSSVSHSAKFEEEKKADNSIIQDNRIQLDIHLVGGFDDDNFTSRKISVWLMNLLSQLAEEEKDTVKMTLKTCAISSMNDNGQSCPIGRGLGVDLRTGEAFLAKVDTEVAGPAPELRSVRLWSHSPSPQLSVIHTATSNSMCIHAFSYQVFPELDQLVSMPDHLMLRYTSTSPDVEELDFCNSVRSTLRFLRDVKPSRVFGPSVDQSLIFRRAGASNCWKRTR